MLFTNTPARYARLLLLVLVGGCATHRPSTPEASGETGGFGVLLMAHGGSAEWNGAVLDAVDPLRARYSIEVAFGMADAATIQAAVRALEPRGNTRIGVVRLFISGESWYRRTEQILGLRPGAPPQPDSAATHGHGPGAAHSSQFWRIESAASFALSSQGLAEAPAMGRVLADRARALSRDPEREDVLILSHGVGDDAENERLIEWMDARAQAVRSALPFRRVQVMTLREDWPDKREHAERRIRSFVTSANDDGVTPIVIPFRAYGFGSYDEVLAGLDYRADGRGLMPHEEVTMWIADQIAALETARFGR
jgi:sirohydrochlorin ferrochelatase